MASSSAWWACDMASIGSRPVEVDIGGAVGSGWGERTGRYRMWWSCFRAKRCFLLSGNGQRSVRSSPTCTHLVLGSTPGAHKPQKHDEDLSRGPRAPL